MLGHKLFSTIQESLWYTCMHTFWKTACFFIDQSEAIELLLWPWAFKSLWHRITESFRLGRTFKIESSKDWGCCLHRSQIQISFFLSIGRVMLLISKWPFFFPEYNMNCRGKLLLHWLHYEKGSFQFQTRVYCFLAYARVSLIASCLVNHLNLHC